MRLSKDKTAKTFAQRTRRNGERREKRFCKLSPCKQICRKKAVGKYGKRTVIRAHGIIRNYANVPVWNGKARLIRSKCFFQTLRLFYLFFGGVTRVTKTEQKMEALNAVSLATSNCLARDAN